jgi:hypothetical protein
VWNDLKLRCSLTAWRSHFCLKAHAILIRTLGCMLAQRGCPMAVNPDLKADDKEAVRLSRAHWHLPVGVIFLGLVLLSGVASAGSMIWSLN